MNETDTIAPASRPYRAVCFDLDGTLLPMDLHEFLSGYYKALAQFAVANGCNAAQVSKALDAGIGAMLHHDDGRTNHDVFWEVFCRYMDGEAPADEASGTVGGMSVADQLEDSDSGACPDEANASAPRTCHDWETLFNRFYEDEFGKLGANVAPNPAAARAIATLREKGYPLVLTTMPLFPPRAVAWRLQWAGIDPESFERLTVYSNSTSVKPRSAYYQENLDAMGLAGEDVLMVGNNTVEDLAFMKLGADAFLVTDWLLNPSDMDVSTVRHGTMEQFAQWVETLPPCACPATNIQA